MGDFFDSIKSELDKLDGEVGGPGAMGAQSAHSHSSFGTDYNANPTVIKQVQAAINALGYAPPLAVDGAMGPKTTAGIQWVQAREGVAQDGIVGDQTLGSLGITPPSGVSLDYATGAVTGAATQALNALKEEFSALFDWSTSNPQPITQGKGVAPGFAATKASVVNSYVDWTTPLEGFVPWMYIDALGYVTTGMGNLIDPVGMALALPWKNTDGSLASPAQITAAWNAVDAARTAPKGQKQPSGAGAQGGGSQGHLTSIRITKDDIKSLVAAKLLSNEANILQNFPNFPLAPADAQMAVHSMAWAEGTGFTKTWPQFDSAFNAGDFATAASQSHMQGVGIDRRNDANKLLLGNAAQVVAAKKDPDTLYYIDLLNQLYETSGVAGAVGGLLSAIKKNPGKAAGIAALVLAVGTGVTWAAMSGAGGGQS